MAAKKRTRGKARSLVITRLGESILLRIARGTYRFWTRSEWSRKRHGA